MEKNLNLWDILTNRVNQKLSAPISSLFNFYNNYNDMKYKRDNDSDKVHHAKANCQTAQYYDIPTALLVDYGREGWDILRKNTWDKTPGIGFKDILKDSKKDIEADNYGLMQGLLHPLSDCNSILDKKYLNKLNEW